MVELIAVVLMTAAVVILAVLQYRWTTEISRSEQTRLQGELRTSVRNFDQDFSYDLERLCESFEIDTEAPKSTLETRVLQHYTTWTNKSVSPGMVAGLHIWKMDNSGAFHLESFNQDSRRFESAAWPARLEPLHQFLRSREDDLFFFEDDRDAMNLPWTFYEQKPALVRAIFQISPNVKDSTMDIEPIGVLVVELNEEFLARQYVPDLVDRDFGHAEQRTFAVTVRTAEAPYQTIYPAVADPAVFTSSPDAKVSLLDSASEEAKRRGHPEIQATSPSRQWQLVVQHPAGSVDVAVAAWRRRNLAISFGLLCILAGSMVLVFFIARRAELLAKLQMEFVAGVSHELCTPLAIINSAAENLVDGVVDNPRQVGEYGGLIRDQGRRLERLVDEVLTFASGRSDPSGVELRAVEIAPIVTRSMAESEPMLRGAGFAVEQEISAGLPLVVADPAAIITCIENLVSNAIKYAGTNRWVAVRARLAAENPHPEVQITVEDKGIGIPSSDLPKIFEPFYRVQAVRDGQIRGVGLGLYLVKQMMERMGGRVSVSSELGRGTSFTLHFPVREAEQRSGDAAIRTVETSLIPTK